MQVTEVSKCVGNLIKIVGEQVNIINKFKRKALFPVQCKEQKVCLVRPLSLDLYHKKMLMHGELIINSLPSWSWV